MEVPTLDLMYAIKNRDECKALSILKEHTDEIKFEYSCPACCSLTFLALKTHQMELFEELVKKTENLSIKDEKGESMLLWAAKNGSLPGIKILIDEMNRRYEMIRAPMQVEIQPHFAIDNLFNMNKLIGSIKLKFNQGFSRYHHKDDGSI